MSFALGFRAHLVALFLSATVASQAVNVESFRLCQNDRCFQARRSFEALPASLRILHGDVPYHDVAPAVVATPWHVDDGSTAALMADFYAREISGPADPLETLAAARERTWA